MKCRKFFVLVPVNDSGCGECVLPCIQRIYKVSLTDPAASINSNEFWFPEEYQRSKSRISACRPIIFSISFVFGKYNKNLAIAGEMVNFLRF